MTVSPNQIIIIIIIIIFFGLHTGATNATKKLFLCNSTTIWNKINFDAGEKQTMYPIQSNLPSCNQKNKC